MLFTHASPEDPAPLSFHDTSAAAAAAPANRRVPYDGDMTDTQDKVPPVPPEQRRPPVEMPPDQPGKDETEPEPLPKGDPAPNEPTRLV
jgi:hypothetical protein